LTEIICISASGKARAAKETVARILRAELEKVDDKRVLITRFADPLKLICRNWFDWNGRMDDAGRSLLRYIGTDVVRSLRPDFWVDFTLNLLSMLGDEFDYVIIPDCRYPNEFDMERYGFQPRHLHIECNLAPGKTSSYPAPEFVIANSESPEQLRRAVVDVAHRLIFG